MLRPRSRLAPIAHLFQEYPHPILCRRRSELPIDHAPQVQFVVSTDFASLAKTINCISVSVPFYQYKPTRFICVSTTEEHWTRSPSRAGVAFALRLFTTSGQSVQWLPRNRNFFSWRYSLRTSRSRRSSSSWRSAATRVSRACSSDLCVDSAATSVFGGGLGACVVVGASAALGRPSSRMR